MNTIISVLIFIIALEHLGFLYLEMFLWTKASGRKIFGHSIEQAEKTKTLAANQGLYNGFLAAGLIWGLFHTNPDTGNQIIIFFLFCIIIAGIYGSISAKKSILYIQALPAMIVMALIVIPTPY
jgi:putative membrane protein